MAEQPLFHRFDCRAVRRIDDVCVDVQRRRDAGVPELLLRDRDWHLEIISSEE
jgi:hypothetical protein